MDNLVDGEGVGLGELDADLLERCRNVFAQQQAATH
jgi:hypothetical protein